MWAFSRTHEVRTLFLERALWKCRNVPPHEQHILRRSPLPNRPTHGPRRGHVLRRGRGLMPVYNNRDQEWTHIIYHQCNITGAQALRICVDDLYRKSAPPHEGGNEARPYGRFHRRQASCQTLVRPGTVPRVDDNEIQGTHVDLRAWSTVSQIKSISSSPSPG